MEKTPRKIPRLNKFVVVVGSSLISCSRPYGRNNECIVINSSSSYKVQQKDDYGDETKSKGKEKLLEDHYPLDNDFEDEIPLSKRLRVNKDQDLKYIFEDLVFMDEELSIIEAKNLTVLTNIPFNKKSKRDRSVRKNENLRTHYVIRQNDKDLPHISAQEVGSDLSLSFNKDLQKISQEVVKVRNELEKFEKNVDAMFVEMKAFMDSSFKHIIQELKSLQNDVSTNKDLGVERLNDSKFYFLLRTLRLLLRIKEKEKVMSKMNICKIMEIKMVCRHHLHFVIMFLITVLVALETGQTYVSSLAEVEYENICVTPLGVAEAGITKFNQFGVIEVENTHISPVQQVRTKIPGKYAQSPYTNLSESGGTSVNIVKYCLWRHPFVNYKGFDMYSEVILHFKKWVDRKLSKKRGKKISFFIAASNPIVPPFEFGVGRVDLMDWFHPLAYPGQPWSDLHVDVIMYYLCKFCKYDPDNIARVTTTDPFFISWVVQIHDVWEANDKDESLISIHHEVAQYIRGDRILDNTPWVDVDHVCIPVNIATDYYALRKDIDWNTDVHYAGRLVGDALVYDNRENIPQQRDNSTDCGLYTCVFAEYVCCGDRNISMSDLNAENLRLRFGALLWEYGKMKIDTESVSEDEASKQGVRSNWRVKE
ncbi:hypothetical protein KY290_017181 [Solanum tuberosum]|uniref:Ubiquitin-like protease family profile domain-containing protein n=1 Tax=Solanum tuberosum TaxID=4113 RepID=A0ABQ7VCN6_SOLTU|nr:hypothetical protein KY284_016213 [Solanum tuberosum]KAH0761108.1 hypothetical protein KY290_017181 [Solanum tuberosum]